MEAYRKEAESQGFAFDEKGRLINRDHVFVVIDNFAHLSPDRRELFDGELAFFIYKHLANYQRDYYVHPELRSDAKLFEGKYKMGRWSHAFTEQIPIGQQFTIEAHGGYESINTNPEVYSA